MARQRAARSDRSRILTAIAFTGLLIGCALLIFRLSAERQQVLEDFRRSAWLAVQAQTELLLVSEALARYEAAPSEHGRWTLEQRFEHFQSRLSVLGDGEGGAEFLAVQDAAGLVGQLGALQAAAGDAVRTISADPATLLAAREAIEALRRRLQSLVETVLTEQGLNASRAGIERQYAWILATMVGVLATGTLLVLSLQREAQNARANYELARRAEADASALKEQLVDAIESLSEGFILLDEAGHVVMANSRYRELYPAIGSMVEPGVAFQDLLWAGAVLGQFGSEQPVEQLVRDRMEQLANPAGPFEQTLDDGRILLVAERRTARGSLVSVCTDITELKRTQLALQRRLAATEASIDGIAIIDVMDRLVVVNPAFAAIFGLSDPQTLIGHPWTSLLDSDEGTRFEERIQPKLRETGRWRGELEGRRPDGSRFPLEVSMTILDDGGMICIARDATEQHRAAAERQQLQEQFYQAQKMEALGRLSGGIAHDFNNILAAIIGYSSFLVEDLPPGSEVRGFATQILAAGNRAKDLVKQILAFSRTQDARRDAIDLTAVVNETLTMLSATMPATVSIAKSVPGDSMTIMGDATQIGQVLMNLCVNARDALPDDRGSIAVELARVEIDGGCTAGLLASNPSHDKPVLRLLGDGDGRRTRMWVGVIARHGPCARLSVRDTGTGMDRSIMERMFEPFFTTKSVGKGTGLGLAAVHGIVAAHGGAITVESVTGKGTTFQVFLPLADAPTAVLDRTDGTETARGRELVLLIEDEPQVAAVTTRCLERLGYEVAACDDPTDALAVFEEDPGAWDVVVTDQTMPNLTGLELTRRLLALRPDIPVVLCTGFSEAVNEETARAAGVVAYLTKPVDPDQLARAVRAALDRRDQVHATGIELHTV